jgi:hypothetical protein
VAVGSADMPVSTMNAAVGNQLFVRTESQIAGSLQTGNVILGILLSSVTDFVAKPLFWTGPKEGVFQCFDDFGRIYVDKSRSGGNTLAEWPNYRLSHLHKLTESFVKLRLEFAISSIDLLLTDEKQNLAFVEVRLSLRQHHVHFIYRTLWYDIHGKDSRLYQFFNQRSVVGSHLFGKGDEFLPYFPVC